MKDNKGLTGFKVLGKATLNKGTAFSEDERDQYGLRGLLPPKVLSLELQLERSMMNLRRMDNDIARYVFLAAMQSRNERLFYRLLIDNIEEIMPLIYTPTVGQACQQFCHIYRRPRGLYISLADRGRVHEVLANWPHR